MKLTRRRATVGAIAAAVLLFTAVGCGSGSDDSGAVPAPDTEAIVGGTEALSADDPIGTTGSTEVGTTDDPATTGSVVPEALQFTAPLVGGGTFDGAAVAGKPTVFWFWAPT